MNQPALADQIDQAQERKTGNGVERLTINQQLERANKAILVALPTGFNGGSERFARTVLTAVKLDPNLQKCTPISIVGAAIQAAQLGLAPILGEAWILPYKNNKKGGIYEAQFQVGWKGYVALADRAGHEMDGEIVYEADDFDYELGFDPWMKHKPAEGDRGQATHWYVIVTNKTTGRRRFKVIDRFQVERRRKVSKSPNSPAWTDWYGEMGLGKCAREACRMLRLSVEMDTAVATDGTVRTAIEGEADEYPAGDYIDVESIEADEQ